MASIPEIATADKSDSATGKPDADLAIMLFRRHFLNRTDRVAFRPPWPDHDACPCEGGDNFDAMLRAHLEGESSPAITICWITKAGKEGTEVGHFRIGTY